MVRRIAVGEEGSLGDGAGTAWPPAQPRVAKGSLTLAVLEVDTTAVEMRVVVVQAIPKGDRGELAVEMLTEVGADVIVPWATARSSPGGGASAPRVAGQVALDRPEAAKQARRAWFPRVRDGRHRRGRRAAGQGVVRVVLHEAASGPLADLPVPGRGEIVIVVGPEGHHRRGARRIRRGRRRAAAAGLLGAAVLDRRRGRRRRPARPHARWR